MVLYHAVSTYQLLEFIVHRIRENYSKATIIISKDITDKYRNYNEILEKFFDKVIIYNNSYANSLLINKNNFNIYFENLLCENKIDLQKYENIFLACTHAAFALYVAQKNIKFIFVEDAAGALSNVEAIKYHVFNLDPERHKLLESYGLYDGVSSNIIGRMYNRKAQNESNLIKLNNDMDFNLERELKKIKEDVRWEIISAFGIKNQITIRDNSVCILTEHFANLKVMKWEEQILCYQLFVDYFLKEYNLVFKKHPDDLMYYSLLFPNSEIISTKFPSEFLPFIFSKKPKCIATISSTAIHGLTHCFENKIVLNQEFSYFSKQFYHLHKYFTAILFFKEYITMNHKFYIMGCNTRIIDNLCNVLKLPKVSYQTLEKIEEIEKIQQASICFVDIDFNNSNKAREFLKVIEVMSDDIILVFINSYNFFIFDDKENVKLLDGLRIIQIKKEKIRTENIYENLKEEYIYFYSKKKVNIMSKNSILLESTGIKVDLENLSDDQLRIKILEGIIDSLEKQLKYYIKLESESKR